MSCEYEPPRILFYDPEEGVLCADCGHPKRNHPLGGLCDLCGCLAWRQAPDETTLAYVLRCMRLSRPEVEQTEEDWRARFRALNIPADVPWTRWQVALERALASAGVLPTGEGEGIANA